MFEPKEIGKKGESIAAGYLSENGYEIIEKNYKYGKGEIDIIAGRDDVLVFVEVKTRQNLEFGPPELAVNLQKQRQIKKIAKAYLYKNQISNLDCRIDLIAIVYKDSNDYTLNHIQNAF
jgi:putative endonuclease